MSEIKAPELLPCPFCGKPPITTHGRVRLVGCPFPCSITWKTVEQWNARPLPASAPAGPEGTPLTDEAVFKDSWGCEVTMAEIPRDLERKLQASDARAARLEGERDAAEKAGMKLMHLPTVQWAMKHTQEQVESLRQERDRLRTALEDAAHVLLDEDNGRCDMRASGERALKALSAQPEAGQ